MFLNKRDSQYASGPEYAEILNIWQNSEYDRVLNMTALHSVLNIPEYALTSNANSPTSVGCHRILTSSPACHEICLFTRISTLQAGSSNNVTKNSPSKVVIKSIDMILNNSMVLRIMNVWYGCLTEVLTCLLVHYLKTVIRSLLM